MAAEKLRIVVTDPLVEGCPKSAKNGILREQTDRMDHGRARRRRGMCRLVPGAAILVGARFSVSAKVLAKADKAYFHQQCSQGYDNIDLNAAKAKGITCPIPEPPGRFPWPNTLSC